MKQAHPEIKQNNKISIIFSVENEVFIIAIWKQL